MAVEAEAEAGRETLFTPSVSAALQLPAIAGTLTPLFRAALESHPPVPQGAALVGR
jgi:hypothetical protein